MHHNVTQKECKRCGKCCIAGGPALHIEDRGLVVAGRLRPSDLVTLRRGEPAYDPVNRRVVFLEEEMIKLRGHGKIGACIFYDANGNSCAIYQWRPLECRVLKCWDTSDLEGVYMRNLLKRNHLIPEGSTLARLIKKYEEVLCIKHFASTLVDCSKGGGHVATKLQGHIDRDFAFRRAVIKDFSVPEEYLDFFFGRPLRDIIVPMIDDSGKLDHRNENE